ncbi:MAG: lysostaphin resistance A-like protein [Promethearchaeota archaeon]
MLIEEKNETLLNFFTPTLVVGIGWALSIFLPTLAAVYILPFISPALPFQPDNVTASLLMLFLGQIIGTVIVFFLLIPFFKVKEVESKSFSGLNFFRTILLAFFAYGIYYLNAIVLVTFYRILESIFLISLIPETGYGAILLTADHIANPFILFLYFVSVTIGAAVFEELVFRRMLIPLLEERGMAPFAAVIASSLIFAFVHLPNDLISGNLAGAIIHVSGVLFLGFVLGLTYVLTRNILFPMIVHALVNFVSFAGPIVILMENDGLTLVYMFTFLLILLVTVGVAIFAVWQYFRISTADWVTIIKEKSAINILPGLVGFLALGVLLVTIPLIMEISLGVLVALGLNLSLLLPLLFGGYIIFIIALVWLGSKTKYDPIGEKTESFSQV